MSALARMEAAAAGRAQPRATVCHRHLAELPLVFVPLTTAGEAGAPLGAMVGTDREAPQLLVVPQPRDRDLRFAFLAGLADAMLPHLESALDDVEWEERKETDPETGKKVPVQVELCADAPQLIVPNGPGADFVRLLGRSMRFRRSSEEDAKAEHPGAAPDTRSERPTHAQDRPRGEDHDHDRDHDHDQAQELDQELDQHQDPARYFVPPRVPLLGRWLTLYGERARVPGSSLLLSMTEVLARHWATGQSALEDQHLGALLAWIDPPDGSSGGEAALRAEVQRDRSGQLLCPPAGPATDPAFDNKLLSPAIDRFDAGVPGAEDEVRELIASQLRPAWDAVWRGIDLLRALPEGEHVAERFKRDRWSYTAHRDRVRGGEPPQPRRDDAVTAAAKLAQREREQARLEAQEALDDPLVMAERQFAGEAFAGEVTAVEMAYSEGRRAMPRPLVTLRTPDRPHLGDGVKVHRVTDEGARQTAEFVRQDEHEPGLLTLRLTSGMGRGKEPAPGTVPEKGDRLCWTLFEHAPRGGPGLPEVEDTPWTHGGPPAEPVSAGPAGSPAWPDAAASPGTGSSPGTGASSGATAPPQRLPEPDPVTSEDLL